MQGAHNVIISVDEELLFVGEGHFAATVLREQYSVADTDEGLAQTAVLESLARSACNDRAEVQFLVRLARGQDDAGFCLGLGCGLLDDDAVEEGSESSEREHFV